MSKAFTRESDESEEEEIPAFRPTLPPGTTNYITREGAERLRQRLNGLLEKKQGLTARSNDAVTAPDGEQRKIESAIRNVQQVLDSVVVAEVPVDQERIAFGATVVVQRGDWEEDGYRIVGVEESDPDQGAISWVSPLARALLSHRVGEKVRFRSPAGEEEVTILSVRY